MNITDTPTAPVARKTGRLTRILTAGALALGLVAGSVAVAAPAQAATGVSFCFTWATTGTAYANQPVYLHQSVNGKWVQIRSGKTAANGCGTFYNTPASANLTVQAYAVLKAGARTQIWSGWAQRYTLAGSGTVQLGSYPVFHQTSY